MPEGLGRSNPAPISSETRNLHYTSLRLNDDELSWNGAYCLVGMEKMDPNLAQLFFDPKIVSKTRSCVRQICFAENLYKWLRKISYKALRNPKNDLRQIRYTL